MKIIAKSGGGRGATPSETAGSARTPNKKGAAKLRGPVLREARTFVFSGAERMFPVAQQNSATRPVTHATVAPEIHQNLAAL
jgi:hypothetical protein